MRQCAYLDGVGKLWVLHVDLCAGQDSRGRVDVREALLTNESHTSVKHLLQGQVTAAKYWSARRRSSGKPVREVRKYS